MTVRRPSDCRAALVAACILAVTAVACQGTARAAKPFTSDWPKDVTRVWVGRQFWANPMQDWRIHGGRLECATSGGDRNVHLLTRQLGEAKGDLAMRVRLGAIEDPAKLTPGWVGFRVGVLGDWKEYRDSLRRGKGLDAGVTTDGHLFIGSARQAGGMADLGVPRKKWKVHHVDSQETTGGTDARARNVFDGRPGTIWHNEWKEKKTPYPHEIQIDLGSPHQVTGFAVLPRQEQQTGRIKAYAFYVSADGKEWGGPVAEGEFKDTKDLQRVACRPKEGRYVRLLAKSGILNRPACTVAELYVFDPKHPAKAGAPAPGAVPLDEVDLLLSATPDGDAYRLTLAAHDPASHEPLAEVSRKVQPDQLVGNLALVCYAGTNGQNRRGNVRFWFRDWHVTGSKVQAHPDHAFGPILFAQYTLSRGVMKMTAQMPPLGPKDSKTVRLQFKKAGTWQDAATATIDPLARTARFRIENWDASRDVPYRLVYALMKSADTAVEHSFEGVIRKDPVDKDPLVLAAFTGNADFAWPNLEIEQYVRAQDPDIVFFSGDNIYEQVGGYGVQRGPLEGSILDYLRKWYFYGWSWRNVLRDRPAVSIPDDHDVYQGNLWGAGGRATKKDDKGGYVMDHEWVNVVHRTQTSHLPDPYDPRPCAQGITVYHTDLVYGRVSFAVVADRQFKSGPSGLVPPTTGGRADHVVDPNFDPKTADVEGAKLLGDRQLAFLEDWAGNWQGADLKCVLSQTIFCSGATHHGGGLKYLVADYDSSGWPQTGRNKALRAMRKAFALHIAGDQHLATLIHHGVDGWGDAAWSLAVPSVANLYMRAWKPKKPGQPLGPDMPDYTGRYLDPFGNRVSIWAATNPGPMGREPAWLYDKKPGYGIVRFNRKAQTYTIECWPRFADPTDPKAVQYEGWPRTVPVASNYGREPAAYLPMLEVRGMTDPVVKVSETRSGRLVYARRVRGTTYRPPVFDAKAAYTVEVGEPGTDKTWTMKNVRAVGKDDQKVLRVTF